jgi:DNA-binding transcriptional MocR family regulator
MIIKIRNLLNLRSTLTDQALIDYLSLVIHCPQPGFIATASLRKHWSCSQSQVSRRINAIATAGLIDLTAGHAGYNIHHLIQL